MPQVTGKEHPLSFAEYEVKVRDKLDLAGVPRNWQPSRAALQVCHARGLPSCRAARVFARVLLPRYERWANAQGGE